MNNKPPGRGKELSIDISSLEGFQNDDSSKINFKSLAQFEDQGAKRKILDASCKLKLYGSCNGGSGAEEEPSEAEQTTVSDVIGSFGWFQLLVLIFSGLREGSVGYDAVIMSIILQPESHFLCADNLAAGALLPNITGEFNETAQCYRYDLAPDPVTGELIKCRSWLFPHLEQGASLVAEWSLVCDQHWLVAFIESAFFFGLVTGNLTWGYYADKLGRRKAYLIGHALALIAGWAAVLAPTIELFALCRFLAAFGSISYNIIYSIQVELIGTKHRAFSTTINHLGWGLGVICVPLVDRLFTDYRYIISVAPVVTLLMFPWAFWLPESSRWLMAHGEFFRARQELVRAANFNGRPLSPQLDKKIALLQQKIRQDKKRRSSLAKDEDDNLNGSKSYRLLLSNPTLVKDTLILAYASFLGHFFYYLLTINFGYMKNLSVDANFITSGAGEWVSVVVGAVLLKMVSRKACMSIFLMLMSGSFLFQALIDLELAPWLDTEIIISTNNGIGTLSALLLVFVALIVNQEVFPTVIRQTGSSLVNTTGEFGSTLAPLSIQLGRLCGLWETDLAYATICIVGMVAVQFITKTDDIELMDT